MRVRGGGAGTGAGTGPGRARVVTEGRDGAGTGVGPQTICFSDVVGPSSQTVWGPRAGRGRGVRDFRHLAWWNVRSWGLRGHECKSARSVEVRARSESKSARGLGHSKRERVAMWDTARG